MSELEDLTIQEAAELLNVPKQHLFKLLDQGEIPYVLCVDDVLAYKTRRDAEREAALTELTQLTQEYGGYDELKKPNP